MPQEVRQSIACKAARSGLTASHRHDIAVLINDGEIRVVRISDEQVPGVADTSADSGF